MICFLLTSGGQKVDGCGSNLQQGWREALAAASLTPAIGCLYNVPHLASRMGHPWTGECLWETKRPSLQVLELYSIQDPLSTITVATLGRLAEPVHMLAFQSMYSC